MVCARRLKNAQIGALISTSISVTILVKKPPLEVIFLTPYDYWTVVKNWSLLNKK